MTIESIDSTTDSKRESNSLEKLSRRRPFHAKRFANIWYFWRLRGFKRLDAQRCFVRDNY